MKENKIAKAIITTVVIIAIIITVLGSLYTIRAGQRGVLLTWGKPNPEAITEGLHIKIPIAQQIIKIDTKTQKYEADASAASRDLQVVATKIAVNYHLTDNAVVELYSKIGLNYEEKIIQPAVQEVVKASTAQFTAEQLITNRSLVKERIDNALGERLRKQNIIMETTSITNFDFSPQFNQQIEAKVTAEQRALTEKNNLATIEFQAQQKIAEANGTATSRILNAQADAQAKLLNAEAEAKALELQKQQVTTALLELRKIEVQKTFAEHWKGNYPNVMIGGTGTIPLLNLPINTTPE